MDATSCLLVLVLLVIVVVGAGMSQSHQGKSQRPKAGMSVGCTGDVDCSNDYSCVPYDANHNVVEDGAGTCVQKCTGPDSCEKKGACKFWVDPESFRNYGYCYSTKDQPCGQPCKRGQLILTGGGKATTPLGGGKAGFGTSAPPPFVPTDGKVDNLLTGGQRRTGGGKAGMTVGCVSSYDCMKNGIDGICAPFDANGNYVKDIEDGAAGICAQRCDENDAAPCNTNGVCKGWETDGFKDYKYCYPTAKQPCTTACFISSGDNLLSGGKAGFRTSAPGPNGPATDGKVTNLLTGGAAPSKRHA